MEIQDKFVKKENILAVYLIALSWNIFVFCIAYLSHLKVDPDIIYRISYQVRLRPEVTQVSWVFGFLEEILIYT